MKYIESDLEQATLEWLKELGYSTLYGPDISPVEWEGKEVGAGEMERGSYKEVILVGRLAAAIERLNPGIEEAAKEEAIKKIVQVANLSPSLILNNHAFHKFLREGVDVEYRDQEGATRGEQVRVLDDREVENNDFLAVNQFTVVEKDRKRRPDVVIFINGLPLVVIELKNPGDEKATVKQAFNQIQTYKQDIPVLFAYNALAILSDGVEAKVGTISATEEWFKRWRTIEGEEVAPDTIPQLEVLLRGLLSRDRIIDFIRNFIVFDKGDNDVEMVKKAAAYHQYHATNRAVESTLKASGSEGDRRAGVVWHTQGSGKSLMMVFYAGKLIQAMNNPTLVVLTDRNDLDNQLFGTFSSCGEVLRQEPKQASGRDHLKELLKVASGGVVFTTIQKFFPENVGEKYPMLSDRSNIVVMADEAHRSQYDFIDGFAKNMRDALPKASFIGFTGTPIELTDKNTRAVFGEYVDVYDVRRAVDDESTLPIYYEARLAKIDLREEARPKIDPSFEMIMEGEEAEKKEKFKSKWARLEALIGNEQRINLVAQDIVDHFEQRLKTIEGKGMIVVMSRRIAIDLYDALIKLRPQWASNDDSKGFLKVVMTGSASDPLEWQKHVRNKKGRDSLAKRMKDPKDELKLAIVRDMWLTGFDAPCLHTMYVDKPMRGHGLMQAIARVNRVYKDKPGGLIVDYFGLSTELKEALSHYSDTDAAKTAIPLESAVSVMKEKYEVVKALFHDFPYYGFFKATKAGQMRIISEASDYVLGLNEGKKRFKTAVSELSKAFALVVPHQEAMKIRDEVYFFQTLQSALNKLATAEEGGPSEEDYDLAIRQVVSGAVASDQVVDIFSAAGLKSPEISILSDEFLEEVSEMQQKNVALELLKKLINDQIRTMSRKNAVAARSFSEMLEETIRRYNERTIEASEVVNEMINLAKKIKVEREKGKDLGLSEEEVAFYDALAENESAVRELGDETLKKIAKELVVALRKNATIDWTLKESVQAQLRITIKRLLKKYNYPPDKQELATKTVIEQAELCF